MRRIATLIAVIAVIAIAPNQANALTERRVTLEELVALSDQITLAVCEGRQSRFHNGNIVTSYKLRAVENWKGRQSTAGDGVFEMQMIGGSVSQGPLSLGQRLIGAAPMVPGEEVLLFTRSFRGIDPEVQRLSGRPASIDVGKPILVSHSQGRYSVLRDSKSGQAFVVRPAQAFENSIGSEEGLRLFLNRMQTDLEKMLKAGVDPAAKREDGSLMTPAFQQLQALKDQVHEAVLKQNQ